MTAKGHMIEFRTEDKPGKGYLVSPEKPRATILVSAPDDEWEPAENVRALEEKIRGAEKEVRAHFYPGTKHWFFEEDRP